MITKDMALIAIRNIRAHHIQAWFALQLLETKAAWIDRKDIKILNGARLIVPAHAGAWKLVPAAAAAMKEMS